MALRGVAIAVAMATARYNEILEALRSQPPPTPAEEPPSSGAAFQKEDPWARPGGIF